MKQMIMNAIKGNKKAIIVGAVAMVGAAIFESARQAVLNRAEELGGIDALGKDEVSDIDDAVDVEFEEEL